MAATIDDLTAVDETVADGDFLALHNVSKSAGTKDQKLSITKLRADAFLGRANTWTAAQTVQSPAAGTAPVVVQGAASQTAALQEWRDSSGNRLARIGATGGLQSSFVNIADDAVATIYTDAVSGVLVFWLTGTTAGAQAGSVVLVRSGASGPHAVLLANGTAVEVTTSDVTGTTGTDGKYTISATATALKIENRLGGTRTFNWFRIS